MIDTDSDWLSAQLIVTPDEPGRIYQDPLYPQPRPQSPNPAFFDAFPSLEFHTYVSNGVLGESVSTTGAVDLGGSASAVFTADEFSIAWYTDRDDDTGTFPLARITLAEGATGTWSFLATAKPAEGPMVLAEGSIVGGAMVFAGDLNDDGFVGQSDLDIVLGRWGQHVLGGERSDPDPSGDGFVSQGDLDIVLTHWGIGSPPGAPAPVPEPATLGILAIGAAMVLRRRR